MSPNDSTKEIELLPDGLTSLDKIQPRGLEWLWPNRIVRGKITIIAGNGGIGKSFLATDIAARISRGMPWPDRPDEPGTTGSSLIITAEDDMEDTVVPRLDAAGADRSKIFTFKGIRIKVNGRKDRLAAFELKNGLEVLDKVKEVAPDLAMVVLDPITGYMGKIDSHANADVRAVLDRVAEWAAKNRVAVLAVTHLNKNTGVDAAYRIIGSIGFNAVARMTCFVEADKDNPDRKLFLPDKNNLTKNVGGLAYYLEDTVIPGTMGEEIHSAKCKWEEGEITISANEAIGSIEDSLVSTQNKVIEWLKDQLKDGPLRSSDIFEDGKTLEFSESLVKKAAKHLFVKRTKVHEPGQKEYWLWQL